MKCRIFFSKVRGAASKFAEFDSIEQKNKFIAALQRDSECVRKYKVYAASSGAARQEAAFAVDTVQYRFYQRWASDESRSLQEN